MVDFIGENSNKVEQATLLWLMSLEITPTTACAGCGSFHPFINKGHLWVEHT
jgi:hypothetical protein